jgi:hypothetical protein
LGYISTNIKSQKHCAFCKYWYDPANVAIRPKNPRIGTWEYDRSARAKCLKKNFDFAAMAHCPSYECKIENIK